LPSAPAATTKRPIRTKAAAPETAPADGSDSSPSAGSLSSRKLFSTLSPRSLARVAGSADTGIAPAAAVVTLTPHALAAPESTAAVVDIAPSPPAPVRPIANIVALPGRIVNTVLQLLGFTTAADVAPSPIPWNPLADLVFAVFRRWEHRLGLDAPVTGQPVPPSLTYTGPLTTATPTVAQFLNAATTEYVLGGTPGGLVPFTVNGWPMRVTKEFTGMTAQVWVTPQSQIIIAYSGTTGGTNLLFNPLIALSQIRTDLRGALTDTTPKAFTDALDFAQRVQAAAAQQGYTASDIFVTGHSLGAWEAEYVAQHSGLNGIGFEGPGLSSTVAGNGADSLFVNTATYGDVAAYMASDLPGLQPFAPAYVAAGGAKPHYGPIVMLGDPGALAPVTNAAALRGTGPVRSLISVVDLFVNFIENHLPGVQAYNLDVTPDPGVVPWLGVDRGEVNTGFGEMTLPEFLQAASTAGILVAA
jgi:hypothetical protein